ncbi:hypothetical protein BG004_008202 [Podila humilis]|nr:hypothetical protein BG004_008202 [Podila humilis]
MDYSKQEWGQAPGGARSPFDDAHQESSHHNTYSSPSNSYANDSSYKSPHQQSMNHASNSSNNNVGDDEFYPVGRPLSYFPTHHQPLSQQEYDDDSQRTNQYHHMSPLEHAQSPLSSRSAEWGAGGYSGYQQPSSSAGGGGGGGGVPSADIPLVGIDIISSNLDARNRTQFSDTRTSENMAEDEHHRHRSNSFTSGAGVGGAGGSLHDNKHESDPYSQHQQQSPHPQQQAQNLNQLQPSLDRDNVDPEQPGEPIPKALLDPKVQKQLRKRQVYKPWFIWLVSAIQIAILVFEFIRGYQRTHTVIQTNPFNPMIGPGTGTIISMGARFIPCMRSTYLDNEQIRCPDNATQICTLTDLCGFTPIDTTGEPPNQWFRFITPIFLHGGIIHLLFNMSFQMRTGADLERDMGWWRIGIIYMASGILGFVFGGNFAPILSPSLGASGSIFGLIGCLVLDLIQNWKLVVRPCWELTKLTLMIVVSFAFGLLPFLDNFAHIGGFIGGILTGLVFMPVVYFSKRDKYIKLGLRIIALPLIVLVLVLGITNFYKGDNTCTWCKYLSCLPINGWCDAFDQAKPPPAT